MSKLVVSSSSKETSSSRREDDCSIIEETVDKIDVTVGVEIGKSSRVEKVIEKEDTKEKNKLFYIYPEGVDVGMGYRQSIHHVTKNLLRSECAPSWWVDGLGENENISGSNPNLAVAKLSFYDLFSSPEPYSDSRGKSSSTVVKGAQLGRTCSLVQRWEKRETLNYESPTTSRSIDTIQETCTLSHTSGCFVLRLMPEPTSVALLYGQHQQQTVHDNMGSGSENIAMIFNMDAGYCDVCVTATTGGVSHIKALSGSHIGGEDIVQNIMHHLLPNIGSLFLSHRNNDMKAMGLLRVAAQDAVIKLSSQDIVMIDVDLENGFRILFKKCESLVKQCVFASRVDVEDISDVIFVDGCSNIPKEKGLVLELSKKDEAYMGMDPLEVGVCSAALEGAVASEVSDPLGSLDLLTIQATPQSLGIEADGHTFVPIIPRNMTILARKELLFTTTRDNQTEALIVFYEGKGKKVDENHILGYFKIMGIPSAPKGIPEISVCIDLDASNVLRVFVGAISPQTHQFVMPFHEVRMPIVDDGHGWCAEALVKMYGSDVWIGSRLVYFTEEDAAASSNALVVPDNTSLFDCVARKQVELKQVLGELGIQRDKRVDSKVPKDLGEKKARLFVEDVISLLTSPENINVKQATRRSRKVALPTTSTAVMVAEHEVAKTATGDV
ncbi:hypothetical protein GIB67_005617 [Kingdonia uniflora]|uniref:Uncharacterized protein n=1 Tax=Kingdonia uniflora TaxID=39325 RepID=A0A7J7NHL9_9MAGN|nr:hypothetical protein GIB67_005617 [Kingdonia uniflora]